MSNINFSEKLFELRKVKGLSQEELAEKVDVSRQTVSKWEMGQSTPEMEKLIALSELFDISIDELVGKEKDSNELNNSVIDNTIKAKTKKSIIFKIIMILIVIYLVSIVYKFSILTVWNNIGQSFNEENYSFTINMMGNNNLSDILSHAMYITLKIGDKILEEAIINNEYSKPVSVTYTDVSSKELVFLSLDRETGKYRIEKEKEKFENEQEKEKWYKTHKDGNLLKSYGCVLDDFGTRILYSINPFNFVEVFSKTIVVNVPFEYTIKQKLNNDYLLSTSLVKEWGTNTTIKTSYSYDYVQDHFNTQKVENPLLSGRYEIEE